MLLSLDVDKNEWIKAVVAAKVEYQIEQGSKMDSVSSRRIAILLTEAYLSLSRGTPRAILFAPVVEKDMYSLAMEHRLTCEPLERESRVKAEHRNHILTTWGIDRRFGLDDLMTQLKGWTLAALLELPEAETEGVNHVKSSLAGNDHGSRVDEGIGVEEGRTSIFASRERNAVRPVEQNAARLPGRRPDDVV